MKKKRNLLVLTVFLIFIPAVFADYEEEAFEGKVYSGGNVTVDGDRFYFNIKQGGTLSASVAFPDDRTVSVTLGGYVERGKYRIYFDTIKKETSETEYGAYAWLDFNQSIEYGADDFSSLDGLWQQGDNNRKETYLLGVRILKRVPHITITRKISKTTLITGEKISIWTEFKNEGSTDAANLEFKDHFPYPQFKFETGGYTGCTWAGDSIKWSGTLTAGQAHECTYSLKASEPASFASIPKVIYYDGFKKSIANGTEVSFLVYQHGINTQAALNPEEASIGEVVLLDINLTNIDKDYTSNVEFTIKTPPGLKILNRPSSKMKWYSENKLVYNGILKENASENFPLQLEPNSAGHYDISLKGIYTIGNFRGSDEKHLPLDVIIPQLGISYSINSQTFLPSQDISLIVNLNNPTNLAFRNIEANIESNMPSIADKIRRFYEIMETSSMELFNFNILAPSVEKEAEFYVNTKVSYTSLSNQEFGIEKRLAIKVSPAQEESQEGSAEGKDAEGKDAEGKDAEESEEDSKLKELEGLSTEEMLAKLNKEAGLVEEEFGKEQEETEATETTLLKTEKKSSKTWFIGLDTFLIIGVIFLIFAVRRTKQE